MNILIPSDKYWKKSSLFGFISFTFFFSTLVGKPPMAGYAPHMYAYNIGFFFPLMMASFGFGIAGFVNYLNIEK
ncbi:MAG: hypothetical protein HC831_27085 [Chloroflexia bacterium]|nr:hypothetical protein [Chloroflexia bacterium]